MTKIWGIVNVTPDSFSDGGRFFAVDQAVQHARRLHAEGADVIDVGGESTRPGAERISANEEQRRILPVVETLAAEGLCVSVDTLNAATARAAVRVGAHIINDVSGGLADAQMLTTVAESGAQLALGHGRGSSADMYACARYERVAQEVAAELAKRVSAAEAAGVDRGRIIIDPGIGFAKTSTQNWEMLRDLDHLRALGLPVLLGTSRKRFLTELLDAGQDVTQSQRDLATAVTSVLAAQAGVQAVRVHDVAATRSALAVLCAWQGGEPMDDEGTTP